MRFITHVVRWPSSAAHPAREQHGAQAEGLHRAAGPDDEEQLLYMNPNRDTVDATVLSYELAESGAIADASKHRRQQADRHSSS